MGLRIRSSVTDPGSYQDLIYSKGGYVLQMIRVQMADPRNPDQDHIFKETMQDYGRTFENQSASTEDFKAIVEKHMTKNMDLDGNKKMDWFFDEYVYGTGMPQYTFHATVSPTPGWQEQRHRRTHPHRRSRQLERCCSAVRPHRRQGRSDGKPGRHSSDRTRQLCRRRKNRQNNHR